MTVFTEEEVAVYEARTQLNCVLHQQDELTKEYIEKMVKMNSIIEQRRKILTECLDKLPEKNVYNK